MFTTIDTKIEDMISLYKQKDITTLTHKYFVGKTIKDLTPLYKHLLGNDPDSNKTQIEICQLILNEIKKISLK